MVISKSAEKRLLILIYFLSAALMMYYSNYIVRSHNASIFGKILAAESYEAPELNGLAEELFAPGDTASADSFKMNIGSDIADTLFRVFNREIKAEDTLLKNGNVSLVCYGTQNRMIANSIIIPWIKDNYTTLSKLPPREAVSRITLKVYSVFRKYIGRSFYRWGGDIFDLDDPQPMGVRFQKKFGLDCSGFVTSGYELAVECGLIPDTAAIAVFCSRGLINYSKIHNFILRGGIFGGNNNYRLDTSELAELGTVIFSLKKGQKPTGEQLKMLLPGDIAGRNGHFGFISFIGGKAYYLESGGYVLPKYGFKPVPAEKALAEFASHADIAVRRAGM